MLSYCKVIIKYIKWSNVLFFAAMISSTFALSNFNKYIS